MKAYECRYTPFSCVQADGLLSLDMEVGLEVGDIDILTDAYSKFGP